MKKSVASTIVAIALLGSSSFASFNDVSREDWYYDAVNYVSENQILNGTDEGNFSPKKNMTRAMAVQALYNMENTPDIVGANKFKDVVEGKWYEKAIIWSVENNIVNGVSDDEFAPESYITKEQLITILHKYAEYKGLDVSVGEDTNILSYDDVFEVSEYALPAMQWSCGMGIIVGDNGNLMPKKELNRAEVATIFKNFVTAYSSSKKAWVELEGDLDSGYIWSVDDSYDKEIVDVSNYMYVSNNENAQSGKFRYEILALKEGKTDVIFRYVKDTEKEVVKTVVCELNVDADGNIHITQRGDEQVKSYLIQSRLENDKIPEYDSRIIENVVELKAYKDEFNIDDFLFESITNSFSKYNDEYFESNRLSVITKKGTGVKYTIVSVDKVHDTKLEVTLNSDISDVEGGSWYVFVELPRDEYSDITDVDISK